MTLPLKIVFAAAKGDVEQAIMEIQQPIAQAGTAAIRQAGDQIKTQGRASISSAGFSRRWANALRVDVYPKRGESIDAAAHIYHKIPYAGVFERGASIPGKPFLWLPLPHTPTRSGGRRLTPRQYIASIGPLHTIRNPGKAPLLGGLIREGSAKAGRITPTKLRAGHRASGQGKGGDVRSIPLFIGVRSTNIRARFGIMGIVETARSNLAAWYIENLKG